VLLVKVSQEADHLPYFIREIQIFMLGFRAYKGFRPIAKVDQVALAIGLYLASIDHDRTSLHAGIGDAATFATAGCARF
jgi:hypothetical protein